MPFGVKSHRDAIRSADSTAEREAVTNAFRREVPSGPYSAGSNAYGMGASPMPFGVKSHRDTTATATTARFEIVSPMPFGVKSHRDAATPSGITPPTSRHQCLSA